MAWASSASSTAEGRWKCTTATEPRQRVRALVAVLALAALANNLRGAAGLPSYDGPSAPRPQRPAAAWTTSWSGELAARPWRVLRGGGSDSVKPAPQHAPMPMPAGAGPAHTPDRDVNLDVDVEQSECEDRDLPPGLLQKCPPPAPPREPGSSCPPVDCCGSDAIGLPHELDADVTNEWVNDVRATDSMDCQTPVLPALHRGQGAGVKASIEGRVGAAERFRTETQPQLPVSNPLRSPRSSRTSVRAGVGGAGGRHTLSPGGRRSETPLSPGGGRSATPVRGVPGARVDVPSKMEARREPARISVLLEQVRQERGNSG